MNSLIVIFTYIYNFALILLVCYMATKYSAWWVLLLIFVSYPKITNNIQINEDDEVQDETN